MNANHSNQNQKESKHSAKKAVAVALLLAAMVGQAAFMPQAYAQGISPDQDSLLPPEVVPLDAAGGNNFANSMPAQNNFNAPSNFQAAQSAPQFNPAEMQTPQEWRKAAFDSMTNNANAQPIYAPQANPQLMPMQGQMGQMPGNNPSGLGQSPWMNANGQPMASAPAQSQTLSGQVAQQPNQNPNGKKGSKLTGISHAVGMASLFGGGMLMGSLMSGRMYVNPMSTGLMGVGLTNYAMRGIQF